MNIEELIAKLPAEFRPWVAEYGPTILKWTVEDVYSWINLAIAGNIREAYRRIIVEVSNDDIFDEWQKLSGAWDEANVTNAARIETQKAGATAVVGIVMRILLASLGLPF